MPFSAVEIQRIFGRTGQMVFKLVDRGEILKPSRRKVGEADIDSVPQCFQLCGILLFPLLDHVQSLAHDFAGVLITT